ncbi:Nodulation-signaling pathway 1 protein [Apostasia shenzhenica]|uniref:Nodulation-signaling pathway 1 protein n=1 Tax=Apostasia shenzhenica TaxID=1088818 RepID=A0A2I0A9W5_9ASPA|nr:Nodulation-signaling pathway 1 protein [Apostasia shenzhenica]
MDWLEDSISFLPTFLSEPYAVPDELARYEWWAQDQSPTPPHLQPSPAAAVAAVKPEPPTETPKSDFSRKRRLQANPASNTHRRKTEPHHRDEEEDRDLKPHVAGGKKGSGKGTSGGASSGGSSGKEARWAEQLLNPLAAAVEAVNVSRIQHLLYVLQELASPAGDANHRLAFYGLQALTRRFSSTGHAIPCGSPAAALFAVPQPTYASTEPKLFRSALIKFHEVSPWFAFPNCLANAAILQAAAAWRAGRGLHVVDVGVSHGLQWPTLLEALTRRPTAAPTVVTITVAGEELAPAKGIFEAAPPGYDYAPHLLRYAKSIELNLRVEKGEKVERVGKEILVVCAQFRLGRAGAEFLRKVREMDPDLLVVSEMADGFGGEGGLGFCEGFARKTEVLWRFLESTSVAFKGRESDERRVVEGEAARVLEEEDGVRRRWREKMEEEGFNEEGFGEEALEAGRGLLRKYDGGWEMRVAAAAAGGGGGGVGLWWKGQIVSFCSIWRPVLRPTPTNAAGGATGTLTHYSRRDRQITSLGRPGVHSPSRALKLCAAELRDRQHKSSFSYIRSILGIKDSQVEASEKDMDAEQEKEWLEAQNISISDDLVPLALKQLEFLAAVDKRRFLYGGPILERAIRRYKTCWLPLLAWFTKSAHLEGSLVVPFDCEWIWHCHRLNPVQYHRDCMEFYGRTLDCKNVQSSLQASSENLTAGKWAKFYRDEPFELDYSSPSAESKCNPHTETSSTFTYDLASAVKRQSSFYYQVCRPVMHDKRFLEGAVARYKGFLHLIKRNRESSTRCFCVPTYDVDLIWHSHQLQPLSYQKDMIELIGKILEHDDTDSDRTKGQKLDVGFSETTKQWEDTYGLRYWRAGAMYRGAAPALSVATPLLSSYDSSTPLSVCRPPISIPLQRKMMVEVLLEIVGIRGLPSDHREDVFVSFGKNKPDAFLSGRCHLGISSETGEKRVASFQCESTGVLILSVMTKSKLAKTIGTISISLEKLMDPNSNLSIEKWFDLKSHSRNANSKQIYLRVAASFTVPVPAPYVFEMVKLRPFLMNSCMFPVRNTTQLMRNCTQFIDYCGNDVITLQMRRSKEGGGSKNSLWKQRIVGITRLSRKPSCLAYFAENTWFFNELNLSLNVDMNANQGSYELELKGFRQTKLLPGRKLEYYQPRNNMPDEADNCLTVAEFSAEYPYGKALALFDLKSGVVKVHLFVPYKELHLYFEKHCPIFLFLPYKQISDDWFVLPATLIAFIISDLLKRGNNITFSPIFTNSVPNRRVGDPVGYDKNETSGKAVDSGSCSSGCNGGCGSGYAENSSSCGGDCGSAVQGSKGGEGSNGGGACDAGGCGSCGSAAGGNEANHVSSKETLVGA